MCSTWYIRTCQTDLRVTTRSTENDRTCWFAQPPLRPQRNIILARAAFDQGEARWDDPAVFQEANNQALLEQGYEGATAGQHGVMSNSAAGASVEQSTLAEYYGEWHEWVLWMNAVGRRRKHVLRLLGGVT